MDCGTAAASWAVELRPVPGRSAGANILLALENKQERLKLAQEPCAEAGVMGSDM